MSERGAVPIELALGIGLLLVPLAMLVLSFVPALERRDGAAAVAAETARLLATGLPASEALPVDGGDFGIALCVDGAPEPGTVTGACAPVSGGVVWVTVTVEIPAVPTPFGTVGGGLVSVTRAAPVDRHRSLP